MDMDSSPAGLPARDAVLVVGGSLVGLTTALALSRAGVASTVLEAAPGERRGGGIGISTAALRTVTGHDPRELPVVSGWRESTGWRDLHRWLAARAGQDPRITLHRGVRVRRVGQDGGGAWAVDDLGRRWEAPVLLGADGYRSVVRTTVDPGRPDGQYAGYLLWRGLIDERDLPAGTRPADGGLSWHDRGDRMMLGYAVPGDDGSARRGQRAISFACYDPGRRDLLRAAGSLDGHGTVRRSLRESQVPEEILTGLAEAARGWDSPWGQAVATAAATRRVYGTPVVEYLPERLVRGRVAVLGDAAHVASPMTGHGYATGLEDVDALAGALGTDFPGDAVRALQDYEERRLGPGRDLVRAGRSWGRDFLARRP
ncbi:FAD-dependent monooxygenase [Streptomyces sp. NPDC051569]|uniref:FAD-dependent monooxygenase n=1 Tax=Streptomyces sp. NPDC051569 TaxID=3365661 RepID=UPI0037B48157